MSDASSCGEWLPVYCLTCAVLRCMNQLQRPHLRPVLLGLTRTPSCSVGFVNVPPQHLRPQSESVRSRHCRKQTRLCLFLCFQNCSRSQTPEDPPTRRRQPIRGRGASMRSRFKVHSSLRKLQMCFIKLFKHTKHSFTILSCV